MWAEDSEILKWNERRSGKSRDKWISFSESMVSRRYREGGGFSGEVIMKAAGESLCVLGPTNILI